MTSRKDNQVSLPQFAQLAGLSWPRAYAAVLRGEVKAEQAPTGRWRVDRRDAERFVREKAA